MAGTAAMVVKRGSGKTRTWELSPGTESRKNVIHDTDPGGMVGKNKELIMEKKGIISMVNPLFSASKSMRSDESCMTETTLQV